MELVAHPGNNTTTIPVDLIVEILSLLPSKSIIRFQSVSKEWFSIIRSKDLVNTFLTRSNTRPHLLLILELYTPGKRFFYSVPEHNNNEKSPQPSLVTIWAFRHTYTTTSDLVLLTALSASQIYFLQQTFVTRSPFVIPSLDKL
ncbi:hypothetical protein Bca4012_018291 [Brassica carinata]|uniref:F-box domain-containing protein n=1 Tax=Brassica carinata TaxID=52824 RepID=A0A8X7WNM0_BRACI|nr:hypothetical protein Bca52824_003310 [Brassica carinata]